MAQTHEMRAEIACTRQQLGQRPNEPNRAVAGTRGRIPFFAIERRWILTITAGGAGLAFLTVFVALYAR